MSKERRRSGRNPVGRASARDRVFAVAADLFYRKGIRAVGVEEIVTRAGVAKISLYRSFSSKDDLIVAYLEHRNGEFWRGWDNSFAKLRHDPRAQLRAIMTYLAERTTQRGYRGCPFINYCAEFPDMSHPGRRVADSNKREMRRRFAEIATALDVPAPMELADGLLLLVEGAYALSQTLSDTVGAPGNVLPWAADALVEAQLRRRAANPARRS